MGGLYAHSWKTKSLEQTVHVLSRRDLKKVFFKKPQTRVAALATCNLHLTFSLLQLFFSISHCFVQTPSSLIIFYECVF